MNHDDVVQESAEAEAVHVEVIMNEATGVSEVVISEEEPVVKRQRVEPEPVVRTRSGRAVKPVIRFTYDSLDDIVVGKQGDAYADPFDKEEGGCLDDPDDEGDEPDSDDSLNEFVADDVDEVLVDPAVAAAMVDEAEESADDEDDDDDEDDEDSISYADDSDDDDDDDDGAEDDEYVDEREKNNSDTAAALPELPPMPEVAVVPETIPDTVTNL